ncbi:MULTISPECIES: Mu transposase C-terminal domain-containing protein [unclassified Pseudomonas]|uniref:Mu transposase C-terminal domain-containing protein n=1 Tax=unclassified Pseudomonas TaxID=196821 RepID=UPI001AE5D542|nr:MULTISPECIES: Mu transposase C-terminal domain-containing protein [unclassified Pseudomonas]MBP2271328.1 putative transposase [Pseudomonas sp. BP6]MBP2289701.1 putative transposase [Pseudomonas sp. BP7]HDS1696521.1 transposase [Pseudomonas putida]HDS1701512.1 transposase [Pseudomonas putida]
MDLVEVDGSSTQNEINRHKIGSERFAIASRFLKKEISAIDGAEALGLSLPQFYRIAANCRGACEYTKLVPEKRGRKVGHAALERAVEQLIEDMFHEHYQGPAATYATVWLACQAEADARKIFRPSYYSVRRRIMAKDARQLFALKYGGEAANQRFGVRPGHKKTHRPLEWVQFDHTVVDILVVDHRDRTKIIGRPWISLAICLHTRVVLGFYLSLLPPSAVSVAMLIENCVMPKEDMLIRLGLDKNLWPVHGLMETIHTDNAKEFISDVLVLNCAAYNISVKHRNVGKKHQGGHIESLIGKFMTKKVHFLPGTTGSNVLMRKALKSEARAAMTFQKLRSFFIYQICAYHETKHSALGCTPMDAWSNYFCEGVKPNEVPEADRRGFRIKFFPEIPRKLVVPEGIELFRRFYYAPCLKDWVRERVLVKYDPYNLEELNVKLPDGSWHVVPCVRNNHERSADFEVFRLERQIRGSRDGTITQRGGEALLNAKKVVYEEVGATARARREKKKQGVAEHNAYQNLLSAGDEAAMTKTSKGRSASAKVDSSLIKLMNNVPAGEPIIGQIQNPTKVNYDEEPVLY